MAEFSDYMENKIIDDLLASCYVALFTTPPADDGSGTEVTGGSYARQSVGLSPASDGTSSNAGGIIFPNATAGWGTVTHFALYDALTGGNMLMHSILDFSRIVNTAITFKFNAGALVVTVD